MNWIWNELECCDEMIFATLCGVIPHTCYVFWCGMPYPCCVIWDMMPCSCGVIWNRMPHTCYVIWYVMPFAYCVIWHWKTCYAWRNWWRLAMALRSLYTAATQQKSVVDDWAEEGYKDVIKHAKRLCNTIYVMCKMELCSYVISTLMKDLKENDFHMIYKCC